MGNVGKTVANIAKKGPVAQKLKEVAQAGLEAGTDALIAGAASVNPALGALATPALKSLQNEAGKEIDDAFKKRSEQNNRGNIVSRASRASSNAIKSVVHQLQDVATDLLRKELEARLGEVIGTDIMFGNGVRLQGSSVRLSNQHGKGIMLGNGVDNLVGRQGAIRGDPHMYENHYQHYPNQRYNI